VQHCDLAIAPHLHVRYFEHWCIFNGRSACAWQLHGNRLRGRIENNAGDLKGGRKFHAGDLEGGGEMHRGLRLMRRRQLQRSRLKSRYQLQAGNVN
jgi:hypothetical protein